MELHDAEIAIKSSFPNFSTEGLHSLGGQTTWTFATSEHVFRFARTTKIARLLENERLLLAKLVDELPVEIPRTVVIGEWSSLPCSSYQIINGKPLHPELLFGSEGTRLAQQLGELLDSLHLKTPANSVSEKVPTGTIETIDREIFSRLPLPIRFAAGYAIRKASTLLTLKNPTLIHSNLKFRHLLTRSNKIVGLTGLTKARVGDVAQDFSAIFAEVGWKGMDDVLRFYKEPLGEKFEERVEFFYWTAPLHDINYAILANNEPALGLARTELSQRMIKIGIMPNYN